MIVVWVSDILDKFLDQLQCCYTGKNQEYPLTGEIPKLNGYL